MVDKDGPGGDAAHRRECLLTGTQASSFPRSTFTQMMQGSTFTLHRFELQEPKVRFVRDDVAVVAYKVREELTVDGKPLALRPAH